MTSRSSPPAKVMVYGLNACSTCDKARAWLTGHGVSHQCIDYREHPIAAEQLVAWATSLGWEKLVNRASYTWRDLPDARKNPMAAQDWLALIAEFPALVKRPVVVGEDGVQVGFNEKRFSQRFDSQ